VIALNNTYWGLAAMNDLDRIRVKLPRTPVERFERLECRPLPVEFQQVEGEKEHGAVTAPVAPLALDEGYWRQTFGPTTG
jgi:hypothetical protein